MPVEAVDTMSTDDTKPTIPERYATAMDSAHLEVLPTACSVDFLIAAGWCPETLGTRLHRLRAEWDAVRGDHRQARHNAGVSVEQARAISRLAAETEARAAGEMDEAKAERILGDAKQSRAAAKTVNDDAGRAALIARALMMVHLTSLHETREALHSYAITLATRTRLMVPDVVVHRITGRALELWIDPICPHCDGRGFTGGFRLPVAWCIECDATGNRGNGRRALVLDAQPDGIRFARRLLVDMDRKADNVARSIHYFTRWLGGKDVMPPAQRIKLDRVLADLRSTQAQED